VSVTVFAVLFRHETTSSLLQSFMPGTSLDDRHDHSPKRLEDDNNSSRGGSFSLWYHRI